jgi:hypothetical protein
MHALQQYTKSFVLSVFGCALIIVGSMSPASGERYLPEIRIEYNKLRSEILRGKSLSETFLHLWSIIGDWTVAYLEQTPHATPDEIVSKIEELSSLNASAVQLIEGEYAVYVISVNFFSDNVSSGTFFVVTKTGAKSFRVAWNIKDVAMPHYSSRDEIGYWAYMGEAPYSDGPLVGYVSALPPSKKGTPRFYIDATAAVLAGGVHPAQISIWEWNGSESIPLFIKTYQMCIHSYNVELQGNLLTLMTREDFETFFMTGQSPYPQVLWTLQITPEGVTDLGRQYLEPELVLIDDLLYRIMRREDISDIAAFTVAQKLMDIIPEQKEPTETGYLLGELWGWNTVHKQGYDLFFIQLDWEFESVFEFTIMRKNGDQYISDVQFLDEWPDKN